MNCMNYLIIPSYGLYHDCMKPDTLNVCAVGADNKSLPDMGRQQSERKTLDVMSGRSTRGGNAKDIPEINNQVCRTVQC